jgi:hypothetical protein
MHATPRPSSHSGFTYRASLLLALASAGLAVFLAFLLPRMTQSRAASPRSAPPPEPAAPARTKAEPVLLVTTPEVEPEAPAGVETASPASSSPTQPHQAVAAEVEGPPLRYLKGGGKGSTYDHRAKARERRKERKERAAATAQGLEPEEPAAAQQFKANANPGKNRLTNQRGLGRSGPGKKKPKDG